MATHRTLQLGADPLPTEGDLASTPFPVLLGRAHALGATGVVSVGGEKFIFFLRGAPVHVDSLDAEETSEVYMTSRLPAPLGGERLAEARAVARDSGGGVGEAMLGLGLLDPNELFELKRSHARQKLIGCFRHTTGLVRFEPREGFGSEILPMPVDVLDAMREGFGRFYDRARLDRELPVGDDWRVVVLPATAPAGLSTEEARILRLAATRPTLSAVASAASLRSDEIRRHVYALYCLGVLALEPAAPSVAATSATRPPPVPADAVAARPAAPPSVPRASVPPPPPRRDPSGTFPTRRDPTGSVSTRRDPTGSIPTRKDSTGTILTQRGGAKSRSPEEALEAAELARVEGDLFAAIEILKIAEAEHPTDPTVQAQRAFLLVLVDARKNAKEANRLAHDARKASPSLPLPYVVMGILLEQIGQKQQAAQMYRHALTRDPECSDASRRLTLLEGAKR